LLFTIQSKLFHPDLMITIRFLKRDVKCVEDVTGPLLAEQGRPIRLVWIHLSWFQTEIPSTRHQGFNFLGMGGPPDQPIRGGGSTFGQFLEWTEKFCHRMLWTIHLI